MKEKETKNKQFEIGLKIQFIQTISGTSKKQAIKEYKELFYEYHNLELIDEDIEFINEIKEGGDNYEN